MRYIFHLGVHRTASRLLQRNLSENLEELRAQGIFYANEEIPGVVAKHARLLGLLALPEAAALPERPFFRINRRLARTAQQAGAETVLISGAHCLGPAMHEALAAGTHRPGFYPAAERALGHLTAGLDGADVQLLVYSRNPETYLLSLYSDAVRQGMTTLDIGAFFGALDVGTVDFAGLEARIRRACPAAGLIMRQYERIKLGPDTFISTFLRDVGLDTKYAQPVLPAHQPQLDSAQVEALRHVSFGDTAARRPQQIRHLRDRILSHAPNPADPLVLPAPARQALDGSCEQTQSAPVQWKLVK